MKFVRYFDGHIIINLFGLLIRIKKNCRPKNITVNEIGVRQSRKEDEELVIVSLTSFPERINTVVKTLKTLLTQTMKPDRVILWLAQEQFPGGEGDLPQELLELRNFGLTIDWCEDIRSYKKILPTLKKYPSAAIITTDDDIYYASDTVETLYKSYLEHKTEVQAHRCDVLRVEQGKIVWAKTRELYLDKNRGKASFKNRLTGYGAVLYPPGCFYQDVCNEELIKKLLPTHDDIWLWAMTVLNGYKTRLVKGYSESIDYVEDSQQYGLCKINKKGVGTSLEEGYEIILKQYPKILKILEEES